MDLDAQYKNIKDEVQQKIDEVLASTAFVGGRFLKEFEEDFSNFIGVEHAIGVSSGTSALHLALVSLGIGEGDEVILPVNTFIASPEAISHTGATPVFVDMEPGTYNLDLDQVEEKINDDTAAILPVHLYGQPVDMEPLMRLSSEYDVRVIEDACQAHGAEYKGQKVGSIGDVAAFSFYPGKNLGAYGDGGIVTTDSDELAEKILRLKDHGSVEKYHHEIIGFNYRLDSLQAAVLNVKLDELPEWNRARRENAYYYNDILSQKAGIITPSEIDAVKPVYHLYVVQVDADRDRVREYLDNEGISTGMHYPIPCHLQPAFDSLGYEEGDFPRAENSSSKILSLPMFPELTRKQIEYTCNHLEEAVRKF